MPLAVLVSALGVIVPSLPASAGPEPGVVVKEGKTWKATALPAHVVQGAKSPSGRLAKSDRKLLRLTSSAPVNVVVKLDYDALAAYRGGVSGLAATSPAATGRAYQPNSTAVRRYDGYISKVEGEFRTALGREVPQARVGRSLRLVYGGVALRVPGNKVADLLELPGVAAVQEDKLEKVQTDSSPAFIGAPTIYNQLGGSTSSGKGVIVGILDTGAWPEHPQYREIAGLPAPPATRDGAARVCDFGDNPTTPGDDVFACNRKLISGQPFLDTYNAVIGGEVFGDSARDSNGHGTHTSTTAAGGPASANTLGIPRGPIHGIAPAAHVAVYKVCGLQGCFSSDSAAAVQRAILDGVRVINFSISGGNDPFSDPVELAFLDAYAAGVLVSASAGNSGPGAGTTNHRSPWVTTVAASMQRRAFQSDVTLSGGGATTTLRGSTITAGISTPTPVVLGSAPPYSNATCDAPAPAGLFAGKIVVCQRGGATGRVEKGFNVSRGGAVGMLLHNAVLQETMTDNHWIPAVHLEKPQGDALLAFLAAHPDTTARFTRGEASNWDQADVMTSFSSRGPGGDWLKPDVTAPGLQILAGMTPVTESPLEGPPGNLYQAIAGTSMSAPHVAGAAALLFALHPNWTPGQVKSALETTGKQSVRKHDRVTPADPFDMGGGRIDLTRAGNPGLTFDETAARMAASATDPLNRIDLNLPSVNAPTMPGAITTTRTAKNVTGQALTYRATGTAPDGAKITVFPSEFTVQPGRTVRLTIVITGLGLAPGQYFGQVDLDQVGGSRDLHLPVGFFRQQGTVSLDQACSPSSIATETGRSTCTVTVQNNALQATRATAESHLSGNLALTSVSGATRIGSRDVVARGNLAARQPDRPTIAPGETPAGYLPLDAFGIAPIPVGDEDAVNFTVPAYEFAGQTFTQVGAVSNGYSVAGGAGGADIDFVPQTLPDAQPPNGVMAPFWTDLDGSSAPGIFAASLTDGVNTWIVLEWRLNLFGTTSQRVFQQWIGLNGEEDVTFTYDPANLPAAPPAGFGLTVGAENVEGTAGAQIDGTPTVDLRVVSEPGAPGGSLTYSFTLKGTSAGTGSVTTVMSTPLVRGVTSEVDRITVQ